MEAVGKFQIRRLGDDIDYFVADVEGIAGLKMLLFINVSAEELPQRIVLESKDITKN